MAIFDGKAFLRRTYGITVKTAHSKTTFSIIYFLMLSKDTCITESTGNVFYDLGFSPDEAALLSLRAQLMGELRLWIQASGLTQAEVSVRLGLSPSRVSELVCGKWDKFSLDSLITLATRAGKKVSLDLADAA